MIQAIVLASHFEEGAIQNYFLFQPMNTYFKVIANTDYVSSWKSKGLSAEIIKPPATADNSLTPTLSYYGTKTKAKFDGSCLKQPKPSYTHATIVNTYIVYELDASSSHSDDPTLKNCLFGEVTLTKNTYTDKYRHSGYAIGFDRKSTFSFPGGRFGQNVIIFGVYMSSSAHVHNKKGHFNSWKRSNTRIRTYNDCRKNVFNKFYCDEKEILLKPTLQWSKQLLVC